MTNPISPDTTVATAPSIRELQRRAFEIAREKGFHEGLNPAGRNGRVDRHALVHTEVSEAAQVVKRHWSDKPDPVHVADVTEESADIIIRLFDLVEGIGGDLQAAILAKMEKNARREYRYGTPDAKPDGTGMITIPDPEADAYRAHLADPTIDPYPAIRAARQESQAGITNLVQRRAKEATPHA